MKHDKIVEKKALLVTKRTRRARGTFTDKFIIDSRIA